MRTKVVTIGTQGSASAAWSRMKQKRIRHLIVTENNRVVGVLSERDLGGRSGVETRRGRTVQDLMTTKIAKAKPTTTLRQAARLMQGRSIGCLPVLEKDRLVGIVTATDVLETLGGSSLHPKRQRRLPDSENRAPFAGRIPRAVKSISGRTSSPLVPAHIHIGASKLDENGKAYIRRKLGMKLGKFANSIERVTIRVQDINGPRGGVDQICRIKVVLSGLPSIVVEEKDPRLNAAIDAALSSVERVVRRRLQRRRMSPLKRSARRKNARVA